MSDADAGALAGRHDATQNVTGDRGRPRLALGLATVLAALLLGAVWVPADTQTEILQYARRQVMLGDAFAPLLAAAVLGLGGLLTAFERGASPPAGVMRAGTEGGQGARKRALFVLFLATTLCAAAIVVVWAGPVLLGLAKLAGFPVPEYRALRASPPWNAIGFVLGGGGMVAALIATFEHRLSWRALGLGLLMAIAIWAVFDLPFKHLLLPPNAAP